MKIGILSNSPGEIYTWVIPASYIIKDTFNLEIFDLYLTPCMFASKNEYSLVYYLKLFNNIFKPNQTILKILFNKKINYDIFLHMGGDILYSTKFKTKENILISYGWGTKKLDKYYDFYLVPNQYYFNKLIKRGLNLDKIIKLKDLAFYKIDKIDFSLLNKEKSIGFMLGSRLIEFLNLYDIYYDTIEILINKYTLNDYKFYFYISPFILVDIINQDISLIYDNKTQLSKEDIKNKIINYLKNKNKKIELIVKENIEFIFDDETKYKNIYKNVLVVTIPGSKTNEIGYISTPMLVILPIQKPEYIPIWGIAGWFDFFGHIGKKIKGFFVKYYINSVIKTKKRFIALPNMIANKEIVKEYIDNIYPVNLSLKIIELLKDENYLKSASENLKNLYNSWDSYSISFEDFLKKYL
ncbi:MAG: hypothetical protein ACPL1F_02090 [bacterium]|jgi:lipid-A-disaccharide synthase